MLNNLVELNKTCIEKCMRAKTKPKIVGVNCFFILRKCLEECLSDGPNKRTLLCKSLGSVSKKRLKR